MWKNHTEQTIPTLYAAYYAIRSVVHISNINVLESIYYAYFHSIIQSSIIFGGNSSNSVKSLILQQKIVRILAGAQPRTSGRSLLKQLKISHFPCQNILSLINFIIINQKHFQTNSSTHNIKTRNKHHLHTPNTNLSCFQKVHFMLASNFSTVDRQFLKN